MKASFKKSMKWLNGLLVGKLFLIITLLQEEKFHLKVFLKGKNMEYRIEIAHVPSNVNTVMIKTIYRERKYKLSYSVQY